MPFVLRLVVYEHKLMLTVLPNDLACLNLHMLLDDSSISVKNSKYAFSGSCLRGVVLKDQAPEVFTFLRMSVLRLFAFAFVQVIIVAIATRE
jgi:hypothetical protein